MYVFPANDDGYRKRKRIHKACQQCNRRRKRCSFPYGSTRCAPCERANIVCSLAPDFVVPRGSFPSKVNGEDPEIPSSTTTTDHNTNSASKPLQPLKSSRPGTPSTILNQNPAPPLASPQPPSTQHQPPAQTSTSATSSYQSNGQYNQPSSSSQLNHHQQPQSESIGIWVKSALDGQKINHALQYYLNSIEAYLMPLRPNRDALISIYCQSIHPIFPVLDKDQFLKLHSIGQAPTLLLHAVLLVAARHPSASPFLGQQTVREFCSVTAKKIRALLFAEVEQDRLTLVRVYALLSLHSEGPDGLENSCSDLQKSIHYAQSLGLHHNRPFADQDELRNIWWSVWCLDRISACVNARPLIINLEDVSVKYTTPAQHPVLAQLIDQCKNLERVIYLYRPNPILSRIQAAIFGEQVPDIEVKDPVSAVLALIQYTAIILAHKRSTDESRIEDKSPPDHGHILQGTTSLIQPQQQQQQQKTMGVPELPSQVTNRILLEATGKILNIINTMAATLPPLPLVPYCVSLTLTIFLRTYPQVDLQYGYTWMESAKLLESMSNRWWVAAAMGKMGQSAFKRLEQEAQEASISQNNNKEQTGVKTEKQLSDDKIIPKKESVYNGVTSHQQPVQQKPSIQQQPQQQQTVPSQQQTVSQPLPFQSLQQAEVPPPTSFEAFDYPYIESPTATTGNPNLGDQFLDMFSQLPNPTSFLDQAISTDLYEDVKQWFEA